MKRVLFILSCVVFMFLIVGATNPDVINFTRKSPAKKVCSGYEVIEAGKGINCYGDTIKLTKRAGFYEVAANFNSK
jgi:hypothetical protein